MVVFQSRLRRPFVNAGLAWLLRPGSPWLVSGNAANVDTLHLVQQVSAGSGATDGSGSQPMQRACAVDQERFAALQAEVAMLREATRNFDTQSLAVKLAEARASLRAAEVDTTRLEGELAVARINSMQAVCPEGSYTESVGQASCEASLRIAADNVSKLRNEVTLNQDMLKTRALEVHNLGHELARTRARLKEAEERTNYIQGNSSRREEMLLAKVADLDARVKELTAANSALWADEQLEARNAVQVGDGQHSAARLEASKSLGGELHKARATASALQEEGISDGVPEQEAIASAVNASKRQMITGTGTMTSATTIQNAVSGLKADAALEVLGSGCEGMAAELADAKAALRSAQEAHGVSAQDLQAHLGVPWNEGGAGCDCDALRGDLATAKAAAEVAEAALQHRQAASGPEQISSEWDLALEAVVAQARMVWKELHGFQLGGRGGKAALAGLAAGVALLLLLVVLLCCCCCSSTVV